MFISSMANINRAKQRELSQPIVQKKRQQKQNTIMIVNGEPSLLSEKGIRHHMSNELRKDAYTSRVTEGAPKSNVEYLPNPNAAAHRYEIKQDKDLSIDLNDLEDSHINSQNRKPDCDWFLNPIHRQCTDLMPYSDLVQIKPLTASVLKAVTEGTLVHDNDDHNDVSEMSIDDFDMKIFQETDFKLYKSQLRNEMELPSPYHFELAKLKHEKLKLEEAYLLNLRCQAELEETRGPKPKWYELKTKHFNRELRKNNDLMSNSHNWKDLIEYRNDLIEASGRWENLQN